MIDIPPGWVAVILGALALVQAVMLALLARQSSRMKKVQRGTQVVVDNTQNSHDNLLRDDLDGKHEETQTGLAAARQQNATIIAQNTQILEELKDHGGAIVGIRTDLRQLRDVDAQQARDIAEVRTIALTQKEKP